MIWSILETHKKALGRSSFLILNENSLWIWREREGKVRERELTSGRRADVNRKGPNFFTRGSLQQKLHGDPIKRSIYCIFKRPLSKKKQLEYRVSEKAAPCRNGDDDGKFSAENGHEKTKRGPLKKCDAWLLAHFICFLISEVYVDEFEYFAKLTLKVQTDFRRNSD